MARPPATDGKKTQTFIVSAGFIIGGFDGKRKVGGDKIDLTHAQATYFLKLKAIELVLEDFDEDDDDETTIDNAANAGETGAGTATDPSGNDPVGNVSLASRLQG